MQCPLCLSNNTNYIFEVRQRKFYKCDVCDLLFVDKIYFLSETDELKRYQSHQNNREEGYVAFLNRILIPATDYLKLHFMVLDYGCGPNDVLAQLIREKGFKCDSFDPFFKPESQKSNYDFIFSTEVFEHFFNPKFEIEKLLNMLNINGYLGIMTDFWVDNEHLPNWYYIADPSHVVFYSINTFQYIETKYALNRIYTDNKRVIIWQKS